MSSDEKVETNEEELEKVQHRIDVKEETRKEELEELEHRIGMPVMDGDEELSIRIKMIRGRDNIANSDEQLAKDHIATKSPANPDQKLDCTSLVKKVVKEDWVRKLNELDVIVKTLKLDLKQQNADLKKVDKEKWNEKLQKLEKDMEKVLGDLKIEKENLLLKGDKEEWNQKFMELERSVQKLQVHLRTQTATAAVLKEVLSLKRSTTSTLTILIIGVPIFILLDTVVHQLSVDCTNSKFNIFMIVLSIACAVPFVWMTIMKILGIRSSLEKSKELIQPHLSRLRLVIGQGGQLSEAKLREGDASKQTTIRHAHHSELNIPLLSEHAEDGSQSEHAEDGSHAEDGEVGGSNMTNVSGDGSHAEHAEDREVGGSNKTNVSGDLDTISLYQLDLSMGYIETFTRNYVVPAVALGVFPIIYASGLAYLFLASCG